MLKNKDIICISSIDWDFIWQGHQEIMSTLAANGNRVLFIENTGVRMPGIRDFSRIKHRIENWFKGVKGIRREDENLYIFSPIVLPFPYFRIARWINKHLLLSHLDRWIRVMDFSDPVIWVFLPTPLTISVIDNIVKSLVVYYCIDNFSSTSSAAKKIVRSEKKLLEISDLVFVTSKELFKYCSRHNSQVHSFPFAVNFKEFEKVRESSFSVPEELKGISRPIVGYVGGVHREIDYRLLKYVAEENPDISFVFIGPIQTDIDILSGLKNVYFLGKKEHSLVPLFIKYFDACMIPYVIDEYTNNVYPTKLNEYLALGKPVISTSLPEVNGFIKENGDIVYVAENKKEFNEYIRKAINENDKDMEARRISVAQTNSWESRIEKMSDLIANKIEDRKIDKDKKWKEGLVRFYKVTRKKFLRLSVVCFLVYFLLFKTSFLWVLAGPLKIHDVPKKADAIVVFGGGVGETGSPGKSTIERARQAVKLYKEGYSNKVIFSSGYTYTHSDAENMKLFAVSMGIQPEDIILEQEAESTYENVRFSKVILDKYGWDTILLVSSPYNMRRVALVFNKLGKGMKVVYAPVINSQFYSKDNGASLEQMRAIMHEYLGILYYLLKGYI